MKKNGKGTFSKTKFIQTMKLRMGLKVNRMTVGGNRVWRVTNGYSFSRYFQAFAEIVKIYAPMMK